MAMNDVIFDLDFELWCLRTTYTCNIVFDSHVHRKTQRKFTLATDLFLSIIIIQKTNFQDFLKLDRKELEQQDQEREQ